MGFDEDVIAAFLEEGEEQRRFEKENEEYRQRVIELFDEAAKAAIRKWCEQIGVSSDHVNPTLTDFDDKEVKLPYTTSRQPNSSFTCRLSCSHSWTMEGRDFESLFSTSVWFGWQGPVLSKNVTHPISIAITVGGEPTTMLVHTKADIGEALLLELPIW